METRHENHAGFLLFFCTVFNQRAQNTVSVKSGITGGGLEHDLRMGIGQVFGNGGNHFGGGSTAGVRVEPVAFLVIKDGITRVLPVALPAMTTADRVIEMVPQVMDRVENFIDKKKANSEF